MAVKKKRSRNAIKSSRVKQKKRSKPFNVGGAPTKKTEERVNLLFDEMCIHGIVKIACDFAGISTETYYTWCREDEGFLMKMQRAKSVRARNMIGKAQEETNGPWRMLQSIYPDIFRERTSTEVSGLQGGPVEYANLSDEELERRQKEITDRLNSSASKTVTKKKTTKRKKR